MSDIEKLFIITKIAKVLRIHTRTANYYIESGRFTEYPNLMFGGSDNST